MYKRFNELNFVIGLFFFIVSLILLAGFLLQEQSTNLTLYTGLVFLVFGSGMMMIRRKKTEGEE